MENEILMITACLIFLLLALKKGFLRDYPVQLASVINDIKAGRFVKRKWHKHALIIPIAAVTFFALYLTTRNYLGSFGVTVVVCLFFAFTPEWIQRYIVTKRGEAFDEWESNKDAVFTSTSGILTGITCLVVTLIFW